MQLHKPQVIKVSRQFCSQYSWQTIFFTIAMEDNMSYLQKYQKQLNQKTYFEHFYCDMFITSILDYDKIPKHPRNLAKATFGNIS